MNGDVGAVGFSNDVSTFLLNTYNALETASKFEELGIMYCDFKPENFLNSHSTH